MYNVHLKSLHAAHMNYDGLFFGYYYYYYYYYYYGISYFYCCMNTPRWVPKFPQVWEMFSHFFHNFFPNLGKITGISQYGNLKFFLCLQ